MKNSSNRRANSSNKPTNKPAKASHLTLAKNPWPDVKKQDKEYRERLKNDREFREAARPGQPAPPAGGAGRYNGAIAVQLRGATPSIDKRPKRKKIQIALRAELLRRQARLAGKPVDEAAVQRDAKKMFDLDRASWKGDPKKQYIFVGEGRQRREVHGLVMQAAMRNTPAGRVLREKLQISANFGAEPGAKPGAPAQQRLPLAVIERLIYDDGPVSIRRVHKDFRLSNFATLAWAYDSPAGYRPERQGIDCSGPLKENAILEAINGRIQRRRPQDDPDKPRAFLPGILDRMNLDFMEGLLTSTYLNVLESGQYPSMGKTLSIDGTKVPIAALQSQSASEELEVLMNRGLSDDECAYGYHGKGEGWRGKNGVFLDDPCGPVMAAAANFMPANGSEPDTLIPLLHGHLTRVSVEHAHGEAVRYDQDHSYQWRPDSGLKLEHITGDKAFNTEANCRDLVFKYGVDPVFPWHSDKSKAKWADNMGVPYCDCSGGKKDMRYISGDDFVGPKRRADLGLKPGDDLLDLIRRTPGMRAPRVRYQCKACKRRVTLNVADAPHIYTRLPFKDVHNPERPLNRHATRRTIMATRNSSESLNSILKQRGFGLVGTQAPRCVTTENQMRFYGLGRLLAISLGRLVELNGDLERYADLAKEAGVDRPSSTQAPAVDLAA